MGVDGLKSCCSGIGSGGSDRVELVLYQAGHMTTKIPPCVVVVPAWYRTLTATRVAVMIEISFAILQGLDHFRREEGRVPLFQKFKLIPKCFPPRFCGVQNGSFGVDFETRHVL